ncbi:MAG: GntR family transcriptional regulator [Candidatus Omnitrophica bacterium]|nr:GntR family transcriptional regulator [Candidatus Omnitrophota bacterium]MCM8803047.1 GntR family transcriptional regulator [Candidatus Omnitrophota bacterium]
MYKIRIELEKPEPLYLMIKKKILDLIEKGELKNGDRIPPEEKIANENGISRGTVRQALKELEIEGLIKRYPKKGTFINIPKKIKTKKICVIGKSPKEKQMLSGYGMEMWGGIEEAVIENGLELSFFILKKLKNDLSIVEKFDGILHIVPMKEDIEFLKKIKNKRIPLMLLGAKVDGFNYVAVNNKKGVEDAIKYLIENGHRKIGGIFSPLNYFDGYERYIHFLDFLDKNGLPIRKEWIKIMKEYWAEKWVNEAKNLMKEILMEKEKPTAIFTAGALVSIGVMECLEEVKEKISIIGFDDFYLAKYFKPPLTVISQPIWEIGRIGVNRLIKIIDRGGKCELLLEPKLIIRKSVKNLNKNEEK